MKKISLCVSLALTLSFSTVAALAADAPAPATAAPAAAPAAPAAKADPDINQRLADLEAEVSNSARGSDAADSKVNSKLDGVSSPGANAWQMTSSALVL